MKIDVIFRNIDTKDIQIFQEIMKQLTEKLEKNG